MADVLETIKEKCIRGKRAELLEEVKRESPDIEDVLRDLPKEFHATEPAPAR